MYVLLWIRTLTRLQNREGNVIVVTLVCTILAFLIAQLGLNKIVSVGYAYLGYLTIPVVMIPYVVHMIATKFDTK